MSTCSAFPKEAYGYEKGLGSYDEGGYALQQVDYSELAHHHGYNFEQGQGLEHVPAYEHGQVLLHGQSLEHGQGAEYQHGSEHGHDYVYDYHVSLMEKKKNHFNLVQTIKKNFYCKVYPY